MEKLGVIHLHVWHPKKIRLVTPRPHETNSLVPSTWSTHHSLETASKKVLNWCVANRPALCWVSMECREKLVCRAVSQYTLPLLNCISSLVDIDYENSYQFYYVIAIWGGQGVYLIQAVGRGVISVFSRGKPKIFRFTTKNFWWPVVVI